MSRTNKLPNFDLTLSKESVESLNQGIERLSENVKLAVTSSRNFGKTLATLEHLQKFLEIVPNEPNHPNHPRILIVGCGSEPTLSKHMRMFLEVAANKGIQVHFMSAMGGSVEKVFKLQEGAEFNFGKTGTPKFDTSKVIIDSISEDLKNLAYLPNPLSKINEIFIPKEKHIPIRGKSSRKGKSQSGSKFHK